MIPSDEVLAIRLSLSIGRKTISGVVSGRSARRPLAADFNTGKNLRECRSGIRVLMKQEKGETGSGVSNSLSRWFLTPPARKQSGRAALTPARAALFYDIQDSSIRVYPALNPPNPRSL